MKLLETSRLILRDWDINDAVDVYEYAKSEKVGPMAGWKPHKSIRETKKIINIFIAENETWAIYSKETNKVIGSIGLHKTKNEKELMLGYSLSEDYWGNGIAVEASKSVLNYAFNTLDIKRVCSCHYDFNYQSKRVIEKLGFNYINTQKTNIMRNGCICNFLYYTLSKEEFNKE